MSKIKTKEKQTKKKKNKLQEVLHRHTIESIRGLYKWKIQYHRQHLKECQKSECIKCKDAEVLIPYYRRRMKEVIQMYSNI